jgi:hypothetical protein
MAAGCRSAPGDPTASRDLAANEAAANPSDLASSNLGGPPMDLDGPDGLNGTPCGLDAMDKPRFCAGGSELCVWYDRGDCSTFACVALPVACRTSPTCGCLGEGACSMPRPGETLKCQPAPASVPATLACVSSIQCI